MGLSVFQTVKSVQLVEFLLDTRRIRVLYLSLILVLILTAIFPFLLAWKVSGYLTWSWTIIFTPLWLFDGAAVMTASILCYLSWKAISATDSNNNSSNDRCNYQSGTRDEEQPNEEEDISLEEADKTAFWILVSILVLFFGFFAGQKLLLALRLDNKITWTWWIILLPLLIFEILGISSGVLTMLHGLFNWSKAGPTDNVVLHTDRLIPFARTYFAFTCIRWRFMRLSFILLLLFKLSSWFNLSWTIIMMPLYIIPLSSLYTDWCADKWKATHARTILAEDQNFLPPNGIFFLKYIPYGGIVFVCLLFLALLNYRLNGGDLAWGWIFFPVYLVGFLLLLAVLLGSYLGYSLIPDKQTMQDQMVGVVEGELGWLRRFGYILGPFQHRIPSRSSPSL